MGDLNKLSDGELRELLALAESEAFDDITPWDAERLTELRKKMEVGTVLTKEDMIERELEPVFDKQGNLKSCRDSSGRYISANINRTNENERV